MPSGVLSLDALELSTRPVAFHLRIMACLGEN